MPRSPRRHLNRTLAHDLAVAEQVVQPVLHKAYANVVARDAALLAEGKTGIDPRGRDAYLTAAWIQDMLTAAGETVAITAPDVAGQMGVSESAAIGFLSELKRKGLLEGSAAGGYRLAPITPADR